MIDAVVPRNIGPIQKVKRVVPGGDKASDAREKKTEEPPADKSGDEKSRRGTRIDDHA